MRSFRFLRFVLPALAGVLIWILFAAGTAADCEDTTAAVPVLMYHSVCINKNVKSEYVLSPERFAGDMEYLHDHGYTPVSMHELLDFAEGTSLLPEKPVVITLDDGFLNNLTRVLPVLGKYGFCAVVSVVGSYTEKYSLLVDRNDAYAYLTWKDIDALASSGQIEIGSHTWDMHSLGTRTGCARKAGETADAYRAALREDIRKLNTALSEHCGFEPFVFAYPYGSVSEESKDVLREEGFSVLLTCEEKINTVRRGEGDLLVLGRINRAASLTTEEFMRAHGL